MKTCGKCSELELSAFIDNELSAERIQEIEFHLGKCDLCHQRVESLKAIHQKVETLPSVQLSTDFDVSFKSALLLAEKEKKAAVQVKEKPKPVFSRLFIGWPVPVQAAAALILCLTILFAGKQLLFPSSASYLVALKGEVQVRHFGESDWKTVSGKIKLGEQDVVRTGKDAVARIHAKKLYTAKLFQNSEWSPLSLGKETKGEFHFKVKKGDLFVQTGKNFPGKKMRVYGPNGEATVVGTTFMVRALPTGETALAVEEGKVGFAGRAKDSASDTWVSRFESSKVTASGSPQMTQPLSDEEFSLFTEAKPEMEKNKMVQELTELNRNKRKLNQQELKVWQNRLLKEADLELASFGFYLLGEIQEEVMAPAEALQQYVSVLKHYPNSVESTWAFEFIRDKLGLVPLDRDVMQQEIKVSDLDPAVKSRPSTQITSDFLKGLEPQRKFVSTQFRVKNDTGEQFLVNRAITLERGLGEKEFRPIGYLDTVAEVDSGELLLRLGKLFSYKGRSGLLAETNTAIFHPSGKLIYTIDRDLIYSGNKVLGYRETFQEPGGGIIAVLNRQNENWNRSGQPIRYKEVLKSREGKILLTRNRSDIQYNAKEEIVKYQDEVIDIKNRLAFESSEDVLKVAVGEQKWVQSDERAFKSMDEVMRRLKNIRKTSAPTFQTEDLQSTPFSLK